MTNLDTGGTLFMDADKDLQDFNRPFAAPFPEFYNTASENLAMAAGDVIKSSRFFKWHGVY